MTDEKLLAVLSAELQAAGAWASEHLEADQSKALQYYLGMPIGNEVKGRSQVISWDVFEAVESALPGFLEPFFSSENIGVFQPREPSDEAFAEQATDYINYLIKASNPGFQVFSTWFKDALLSKVGVVRVEWEEEDPVRKQWTGLMDEQLTALGADQSVQVIEHKAYTHASGAMAHDVTFLQRRAGRVRIENVRPENFVLTSGIGSIDKARVIGEWVKLTRGDLKLRGIRQHADVQSYDRGGWWGSETVQALRDGSTVTEMLSDGFGADPALEEIELFQGYVRCDRNRDGIAEWRRVLVGGGSDPVLQDDEAEEPNYALISPILIPHRVIGLSYADVAVPMQDIKTALLRQYFDSLYLANRPRTYVNLDAHVSIDDLLSDRIGGLVRGRGAAQNALQPLQTTAVSRDALDGLQLADTMRETRLGIPRFNPGLEADALHKTATGVRSINNLVDKRQKMVLRTFAETGISHLFRLVLRMTIEHQDVAAVVRLRGKFVQFDPRLWNPNMDVLIEVGVGTSDEAETMMLLQQFGSYMTWAQQSGSGVVQPPNVYEFGKMLAKNARLKGADQRLLTDPKTLPPPQPPQDPKLMLAQFEAQQEQQKFQAQAQIDERQRQFEAQLQMMVDQNRQEWEARQKAFESQQAAQMEQLRLESAERIASARLVFEQWKVEYQAAMSAAQQQVQPDQPAHEDDDDGNAAVEQALQRLTEYVAAPARIVRDSNGVAVGVEKGGAAYTVLRDANGRPSGLTQ